MRRGSQSLLSSTLSNVVQRLICAASLFLIVSMLTCAEEEKVQSHRSKRTSAKRQWLLHLHNGPISALRPSGFSITQVFRAYPTVDGSVLQHSEKYSRSLISLCEFGLVFFFARLAECFCPNQPGPFYSPAWQQQEKQQSCWRAICVCGAWKCADVDCDGSKLTLLGPPGFISYTSMV